MKLEDKIVAGNFREYYWLVAGQVHWTVDSPAHRNLNCIVKTKTNAFAHVDIAKAQQLLQMRLMNEAFPEGIPDNFTITDVFMMGISSLGHMTPTQFQNGFEALAAEQSKAQAVLASIPKAADASVN